ncbi:MAG: hypothetical protein KAY65_16860, partial [Planctomycetes bacterium]|nr:hypothetical protein [Planctomycetota bacterium]
MSKNLLCLISSVLVLALVGFVQADLLVNRDFEADLALVPNPGDTDANAPTGWEYDRYYGYDVDPWLMNVSAIGDGSGGDVGVVFGTWEADAAWNPAVAAYPESAVEAGQYTLEVTMVSTGGTGEGWLDVQLGWFENPADPWASYAEYVREWVDVSLFGDGVWTTLTWDFKIPADDPSIGMNWYLWLRGQSYDDYVIVGKAKLATVYVNIATKPYPANDEEGVLIGSTLSWTPIENGVTRDVYFGASSPPAFVGNQEGTSYYPGLLDTNTTYYWQIDEVVGTMVNTGDIWSFTTGSSNVRTDTVIAVQSDDGEDHIHYGDTPDDGAEARDSSDLEMPWEGEAQASSYQVIGLRFVDMPILKGTPISGAYVQFKADNENLDGGPVNLIISGLLQPDTGELG